MRLLVGALVCFGTLQLIAGQALAEHPSSHSNDPGHAVVAGEHTRPAATDWLSLDSTDRIPDGSGASPRDFDQPDRGPVLLPLPAEAWTSATLLITIACFRGLKRARIL